MTSKHARDSCGMANDGHRRDGLQRMDLRVTTPRVQGSPSFFNATSRHGILKRSLASPPRERASFWSLQPPARRVSTLQTSPLPKKRLEAPVSHRDVTCKYQHHVGTREPVSTEMRDLIRAQIKSRKGLDQADRRAAWPLIMCDSRDLLIWQWQTDGSAMREPAVQTARFSPTTTNRKGRFECRRPEDRDMSCCAPRSCVR